MSEMVERVTTAMSAAGTAWLEQPGNELAGWEDIPMEVFARGAIEAMRQPNAAMLEAWAKWTGAGPSFDRDRAEAIYRAMIEAALSNTERNTNG